MVAIISTVAFSAIGTLYGFQTLVTNGIKEMNPHTFSYKPPETNKHIEKTWLSSMTHWMKEISKQTKLQLSFNISMSAAMTC
ncbi:hypothetical protein PO124_02430 [Bacillus licheniformis]|nr:hypothetical protein [Bacillus licheniformis]